jgi:hypothetical protein
MRVPAASFLAACLLATVCSAETLDVDAVLDNVREATGFPQRLVGKDVELSGHAKAQDMKGTFVWRFDSEGRFFFSYEGPVSVVKGFDGESAWTLDPSGILRVLDIGERELLLGDMWVSTGYWLAEPSPFEIKLDHERSSEKRVALRLAFENGVYAGTMFVDRKKWRPLRFVLFDGDQDGEILLGDYEGDGGVVTPRRFIVSKSGRREFDVRLTTARLETSDPTAFLARDADPEQVDFDRSADPELVVIKGSKGHHFVKAEMNGEFLGWCLFDTGASTSVLSKWAVGKLELGRLGGGESTAIGGEVAFAIHELETLRLGQLTVLDLPVTSSDLESLGARLGVDLAAIIGNDVLGRCVVEYDQTNSRIAIHDPGDYELPHGDWTELLLYNGKPATRLTYEGHTGIFTMDTAAPSSGLLIGAATVRRQQLLKGRQTQPSRIRGIAGGVSARMGTLTWVDFGGQRIWDVPVRFITEAKGSSADRFRDGILGTVLLEKYRIVLDYPNKRVAYLRR